MTPHDFKPADHYDILGIPRDANERAIKEAYRRLVRTLHPDVNADPAAHDRFRAVSEAYRILSDPSERKRYDMRRLLYLSPLFGRLRRVVDDPARVAAMAARAKKVLERLASPPREPRPKRGRDLAIEIGVSFADAFTGATRRVTFARDTDCDACAGTGFSVRVPCEACHGAGYFAHEAFPIARKRCPRCAARGWIGREPCVVCDATGRESVEAKLAVKVPAGVSTGTRLRLSGEGERGHAGGANGDLVARVAVDSDPRFRREGRDLVT
ncbi:DnaJ domain-containing protein, partial [bacterium]|nr:DnaJ domain-containing protein [bacterium]